MGLVLTIKDADFSANAIGYIPAVAEDLEYLNFFGGDATTLTRNLAKGKPAATVFGNPTVNANSITCQRTVGHIQTGFVPAIDQDLTMIVVGEALEDDSAGTIFVGNNNSIGQQSGQTTNSGAALYASTATSNDGLLNLNINVATWDGASGVNTVVSDANAVTQLVPAFLSGRFDFSEAARELDNKTAGLNHVETDGSGNGTNPGEAVRIGASYSASFNDPNRIYFAAIYSRFLTDTELTAVYESIQAFYSGRGIDI